jgi:hypothetical protein
MHIHTRIHTHIHTSSSLRDISEAIFAQRSMVPAGNFLFMSLTSCIMFSSVHGDVSRVVFSERRAGLSGANPCKAQTDTTQVLARHTACTAQLACKARVCKLDNASRRISAFHGGVPLRQNTRGVLHVCVCVRERERERDTHAHTHPLCGLFCVLHVLAQARELFMAAHGLCLLLPLLLHKRLTPPICRRRIHNLSGKKHAQHKRKQLQHTRLCVSVSE